MTAIETTTILADRLSHPDAVVRELSRSGQLLLTFPGVDAAWPTRLATTLKGRPWLRAWVDEVASAVNIWAAGERAQASGWFGQDLREVLSPECNPAVAVQAPFLLAGTVLTNLACLAGLEADGLELQGARATGHSAGLISAAAAGGGSDSAAAAVVYALILGVTASATAGEVGLAASPSQVLRQAEDDETQLTPMAAVRGLTREQLAELLTEVAGVERAMTNGHDRHVVSGNPAALTQFRARLEGASRAQVEDHKKGRIFGAPLKFAWEPLGNSVGFHHSALAPAAAEAVRWAQAEGVTLTNALTVLDPATGEAITGEVLTALAESVLATPQDWAGTLLNAVATPTVVLAVAENPAVHAMTAAAVAGTGTPVLRSEVVDERRQLFSPVPIDHAELDYSRFAPQAAGGQVVTKHTRLTGRSPFILAGMTPTTVDAGIVAAAANAGHVAELAGGGQVSERIFTERMAELAELLEPGHEVVFNALNLDPYLWDLHLEGARLVQKARANGAPICGVTISAGIPEREDAVALLDELNGLGIWLNALKPGNVNQVHKALQIADDTEHLLWLHVEGGQAGGHHSWDNLEEILLATYADIRSRDNVVLAVGGGVGTEERAAELLSGQWSTKYGVPAMPVDAILLGTVAMTAAEATTSASVKQLLVDTAGPDRGWVRRSTFEGGMTSGLSGLNADIYFVDNQASRTGALLDQVAGDAEAVAARREEIIAALDGTAKPYIGDLAAMTYEQFLRRFAALTAIGTHGRYQDGVWLDPSHRERFRDLLQRAEARLHTADTGSIPTLFADPDTLDDPTAAIDALLRTYPQAGQLRLHPADVDFAMVVFRRPGKPVPFVPVIDADVRRWYSSDSLWQSHDEQFDADQVLVIPGPAAVAGIAQVDEPIAHMFGRFESYAAAGLPQVDEPIDLLHAVLAAPTVDWAGRRRPNPLLKIAQRADWQIDGTATWADGSDYAVLRPLANGSVELEIGWTTLAAGDGQLRIELDVVDLGRGKDVRISREALVAAGAAALGQRVAPVDAAAHAAVLESAVALPDAAMQHAWPSIFDVIARTAPDGVLDLVHATHRIEVDAASRPTASSAGAELLECADAPGGFTITTRAMLDGYITTDTFYVAQPAEFGPGQQRDDAIGWVDSPHLKLGELTVAAPRRLESFARVTGDLNPIHRSDVLARFAGLPGRIVHGMWTSALGQRAAVELACDGDVTRLQGWSVTFTAPVLPGTEVSATVTRTGVANGLRRVEVLLESEGEIVAVGTATVTAELTAYVFPGQGIQHVGMGMDGYERSEAARAVWDTADAHCREALGFSILTVVRDNPTSLIAGVPGDAHAGVNYRHPAGVLYLTQFTQVAMATLASAQVAELREAGAFDESAITAGHSVGEYNALAAVTGTLALPDLLELVFARGTAMHHLVPRAADGSSDYRLGVVRPHLAGLDHPATEALVAEVARSTGQLCQIVNHNLKGKQYAVAGTVAALEELQHRLGSGVKGKAPFLLVPGIDVPFHSEALLGGVPEFRTHLDARLPEEIDPAKLVGRYIPNLYPVPFEVSRAYVEGVRDVCDSPVLTALLDEWESTTPGRITRTLLVELLAWQFAMPVRWIETTDQLCALGVQRIIEIGVGAQPTLTNLTKGALALPSHRGSRPAVLNVETDEDDVFERTATPEPAPEEAPAEVGDEATPAQAVAEQPTIAAAPQAAVADAPVAHADALLAVVAARSRKQPDLGQSIEDIVDGASSRRNQMLMDIGKEFGVSGMDGAHEVPLAMVAEGLAGKASSYKFPGPVLAAWLDSELAGILGPLGTSKQAVAERVTGHWGLPAGWVDQALLAIALGATGSTGAELVDAAIADVAARRGVTVAPAAAATAVTAQVASAELDRFEEVLARAATSVLTGLDRLEPAAPAVADDTRTQRLAVIDAEHGTGHDQAVAGTFSAERHVHLESSAAWARADIDHLIHAVAAGEEADPQLIDQIAAHAPYDPRIGDTLRWYAGRAESFGKQAAAVLDVIEEVLTTSPRGVPVDLWDAAASLRQRDLGVPELVAAANDLTAKPGQFADQVALVTGASPGSIALSAVRHLLRGSATVVLVTSNDSPERIDAYRDLERRYAGPGAQLHIVRANLASFTDIDALLEWLTTPTTRSAGATTVEVKPALWPTLVLPFAAGMSPASLADTGPDNEIALRLMLLGVQRLVGSLGERIIAAGQPPARVILPMSPNHGTFGGDGSYGDSKAALETVVNRWAAEQKAWGAGTRLVATQIGWVRGTGLMAGNDAAASVIEQRLGIHTFTADEMGTLIAAACTPQVAQFTATPWRLDLTGGLAGVEGLADLLGEVSAPSAPQDEAADELLALPNIPSWPTAGPAFEVEPTVDLDDMVVIVGISELGPWGGSTTRWEAELGELSADGLTELAWRMGLITWNPETASWSDSEGAEIGEADVADLLAGIVRERAGVRRFSTTGDVAAEGTVTLTEVYLDAPTAIGGTTYPAGTAIRIPTTTPLRRQVGGQFPTGVDPVRHGLEEGLASAMDPLAAWNLVVTAEALAAAGLSAEELSQAVHPSRIGNVQGTGMGGMNSLHQLYVDPLLGTSHANDLLQEALGNVVSAHVNQGLIGGYGPMVHPVAACATAAVSLEEAVDKIRLGKADVLVAGGWDDLSSEGINGFAEMSATADNAELIAAGIPPHAHSRPGDRRRGGFVESQGGGSFLVMRASTALGLGLPVRAVVAFAGSYGDGVQTSIPAPGLGALSAAHGGPDSPLATALRAHGLHPDDVAVVSKHDTSTHANDPNEAQIHATISQALGRSTGAPLRVVSQKSVTGHAKGGAAAWQLAGLCDVFATGIVPGNHNLTSVDPRVTPGPVVVDHRNLRLAEPVRAALLTSLGFGHVSALVALAHPAVFWSALSAEQRDEYARRSSERVEQGRSQLLAARYGGDPVFRRRTERMDKNVEIDLLIGASA